MGGADLFLAARAIGALALVVGAMAGFLYVAKRRGIGSFKANRPERRLAAVERLTLDQKHMLHLVRVDDTEMMVVIGPQGVVQLTPPKAAPAPGSFAAKLAELKDRRLDTRTLKSVETEAA
jgi:flagellar biogenesis protein FliO